MRFVHTADLHLGRRIAQMSLEQDLEHVLAELASLVMRSGAQALVVAGDVFDSSSPQESAMRQWDRLITRMAEAGVSVLAIGGNQDAGACLAVGSELIARSGIRVAGELAGEVACAEVGGVNFWLIPFVRPTDVRSWALRQGISGEAPESYDDAMRLVCDHIRSLPAFSARPNVAVAHQLVVDGAVSPVRSDSEQQPLGDDGLDAVDHTCFAGFDYIALGYLHAPQSVGRDTCRYAGSPLKLSASEASLSKSFTVVGIRKTEEGVRVKTKTVEVEPLRDFRVERGTFAELVARAESEDEHRRQDFVRAIVVDDDATDVVGKLRAVWPNLEQVIFDNEATRGATEEALATDVELDKGVIDLFREFFERETGMALSSEQEKMVADAYERAARKGDE